MPINWGIGSKKLMKLSHMTACAYRQDLVIFWSGFKWQRILNSPKQIISINEALIHSLVASCQTWVLAQLRLSVERWADVITLNNQNDIQIFLLLTGIAPPWPMNFPFSRNNNISQSKCSVVVLMCEAFGRVNMAAVLNNFNCPLRANQTFNPVMA